MIAKAKVISHGANAIRYSVDKDKAEIVKTNLLPDDISPTAMWARMLALQKKFEDKLNRYHPLKRNMIRIEVSPTSEETQGWTMEEWQRLADDFIREFDAVDLSAKSKRKSAKATNLKDSQYVVALHRDSKSGIMHLHIDANRIDIRGNVNDAHYIYERAMAAAAKVGQQRDWKDAQEVSRQNKEAIINDCLSVLAKMSYFDWGLYTKCLTQMGYDVKLQSDNKGQVRGYAIKRGNSIYKSSELGKGRCLMPSKIEGTWAKLHHQELEKPVSTPTKNTQQPKIMTVPKPMPTADDSPKIRHFDFYTDEFHHYPVVTPNARHYLGFDKDDAGRQFVANFRKVAAEMGFRHEHVQAYHPLGCYKDWNDALLNKKSAELIAKGEPDTFDYAEFIAAGKAEKQREKEEKNTYHRSV